MKTMRRFLLGVVLSTLMLMMCGISVCAATKPTTLKEDKYVTEKGDGNDVYRKITIPNDGYITVTFKNPNKKYISIEIYDNSKKLIPAYIVNTNEKSGTVTYALPKGTYYLLGNSGVKFQYKYKFTKVVNKKNYCPDDAITLKANKTATVVQTKKNFGDRWYKITLTKKQVITYWFNGSGYVTLYDSDMNEVEKSYVDGDKYKTTAKQKKGTYYVRIHGTWGWSDGVAKMSTFKWK